MQILRDDGVLQPYSGESRGRLLRGQTNEMSSSRLENSVLLIVATRRVSEVLTGHLQRLPARSVRMVIPAEFSPDDVNDATVVVAIGEPNQLERVGEACSTRHISWVPVRVHGSSCFVGPGVIPPHTPDFRDVTQRRHALARNEDVHVATWNTPSPVIPDNISSNEASWISSNLAIQIERWISRDSTCLIDGHEVELDVLRMTVKRNLILPIPDAPKKTYIETNPKGIINRETGIIGGVKSFRDKFDMPPTLTMAVAQVADMNRISSWPNDTQAFGFSWHDEEAAQKAAVGEAVERYCAKWIPPDRPIFFGSYEDLVRRGDKALDPDSLVLYDDSVYKRKGFPYIPFRRHSPTHWVRGTSLTQREELWVPAFLVYVQWHKLHKTNEPRYAFPMIAGIATGETEQYAQMSALEEVVERDATMIWWANAHPLPQLSIQDDLSFLIDSATAEKYDVRFIHLDSDIKVPVIAAAVRNVAEGWLTIGFAARESPMSAAKKALAEGFGLQVSCRALDNERTVAALKSSGAPGAEQVKPWRADRRYLDSYAPNHEDVVALTCQQQIHLDPRAMDRVRSWCWDLPTRDWSGLPSLPERSLEATRHSVEASGYEVISVDVTTRDIAAAGLHCVRVLVPGLVSNFPAAYPLWGSRRVQDAAVHLGWRASPLDVADLNTFPLAHA
ncbi:MAG TPA: YcaO-like family protein [Streptomyces sp.]